MNAIGARDDLQRLIESRLRGLQDRALWCGGVPIGGQASSNLLGGHGVLQLVPGALAVAVLLAALVLLVRRFGARPAVLAPGQTPPPALPEPAERSVRPPAPAGVRPAPC